MRGGSGDLWIFAYGSLMWQPGFAYAEVRSASLVGYHRAFCIYSIHYRGSPSRPGLVLGLDRGGVCHGLAYRVPARDAAATLSYLRRRELIYGVYREAAVTVTVDAPGRADVRAVTYIAERAHRAYAGRLALEKQVRLIRGARGTAGTNLDYLINTLGHLSEAGIRERNLERILTRAGPFAARHARAGFQRHSTRAVAANWASRRTADAPAITAEQRSRFGHRKCLSDKRARLAEPGAPTAT